MKNKVTIPIFVPHKGCPNDCVFCNQRRITGITEDMNVDRAREVIETYLSEQRKDTSYEIAFFGGSFTAIEKNRRRQLLTLAKCYIDNCLQVAHIRISTRPDCIDDAVLEELKNFGVQIIELGVQSMDEEVLQKSNRGHDKQCVFFSAEKIKKAGFSLGLQMMLGLPGDSEEKSIATAHEFVEMKPNIVRIYPTLVVEDTELANQMRRGQYAPWSVERAVEVAKKCKVLFAQHHIAVIRMGLQATEEIQSGKSVLGGPFHAAFGEMVFSAMYRDFLEELLFCHVRESGRGFGKQRFEVLEQLKKQSVLDIRVPDKAVSKWIGNRKSVISYFLQKYGVKLKIIGEKREDIDVLGQSFPEQEIIRCLFLKYYR